jgi:monoamine oxidase
VLEARDRVGDRPLSREPGVVVVAVPPKLAGAIDFAPEARTPAIDQRARALPSLTYPRPGPG